AKVLLLEAGGRGDWGSNPPPALAETPGDSPVDWGYPTGRPGGRLRRRSFLARRKGLRGCGSIHPTGSLPSNHRRLAHWRQLGNRGWGYDDVLPYFVRSEGNERYRDSFHGNAGPLTVSDPKTRSRLADMFMEAGRELGLPMTEDVNGARQEGFGHFQATI